MRPERSGEARSKSTVPFCDVEGAVGGSWVLSRVKVTVLASGLMLKDWCWAKAKGVQRRAVAREARRVRGVHRVAPLVVSHRDGLGDELAGATLVPEMEGGEVEIHALALSETRAPLC